MTSHLRKAINRRGLRELAGRASFERGEAYWGGGKVALIAESEREVTASVCGTRKYEVKLWVRGKNLRYECDCPFAVEGSFCKHCVAVGLALVESEKPDNNPVPTLKAPSQALVEIEVFLQRQEHQTLVRWLMEQAGEDARLREKLLSLMQDNTQSR